MIQKGSQRSGRLNEWWNKQSKGPHILVIII